MYQRVPVGIKLLSIVCFCVTLIFSNASFARSREFTLSSPYWYIEYDRAGYIDITYWYPSPQHGFGPHEMMTGDFAAAVSYSGLNETDTAEWLTNSFIIPSFSTGSSFTPSFSDPASQAYNTSNDPNNPVWEDNAGQPDNPPYSSIQRDTGWSKVDNDELEVKIYYEVIALPLVILTTTQQDHLCPLLMIMRVSM